MMVSNMNYPSSRIEDMAEDKLLKERTKEWMNHALQYKYTYGFTWLGVPIIQQPQDIMAIQEIIWKVKPDLIIETGIAFGGSLLLSASMLELLGKHGCVIGIDIDIREQNRNAIEKHPLSKHILMIEGSSTDASVISELRLRSKEFKKAFVILDSNHTHEHVLHELLIYSEFVGKGSYVVVCDTRIEECPPEFFQDRPWGVGNNPKTAVREFLKTNDRFVVDEEIQHKLLITANPEGYLKCIKE